jgi:hypothetical protein
VWGAWVVSGLAAVALALITIGLPATLVLAGGWLLAVGLGRAVLGITSPASWAAAVVVEVVVLSGISGLVALVSPRPHDRVVDLAILATPALLGVVLWIATAFSNPQRRIATPGALVGIALTVVFVGLGTVRWVASLGRDYGVAWAMSGDSRNEVFTMRSILAGGGLTVHQLRAYPAVVDNLMALISAAGGRTGLRPGDLMLHDAQAVASTYVLAGIAVALLLVAALIELLPGAARSSPTQVPLGTLVVLSACAITSASPLVLGTALNGGFVDAYATLPVVISALVVALRFCSEPSPLPLAVLGLATIVTLFSWSILAIAPGALVVFVAVLALRQSTRERSPWRASWPWIGAGIVGMGGLLVTIGVVVSQRDRLRAQFVVPGAIITPQTRLIDILGLLALGLALTGRDRVRWLQMGASLVVVIAGVITLRWLISLPQSGTAWTYYAVKTLWLTVSALIWLGFAPVLLAIIARSTASSGRRWRTETVSVVGAASWSGVVLIIIGFGTTATDPLPMARAGWDQPSAAVVAEVVAAANTYPRFVLWQWADIGNERLGNFWASLAWDSTPDGTLIPYPPGLPGGLELWAYFETGSMSQLCTVVKAVPDITVITANSHLPSQLQPVCPRAVAKIVVVPGPSAGS